MELSFFNEYIGSYKLVQYYFHYTLSLSMLFFIFNSFKAFASFSCKFFFDALVNSILSNFNVFMEF